MQLARGLAAATVALVVGCGGSKPGPPPFRGIAYVRHFGFGRAEVWVARLDGTDSYFKDMTTQAYQAFDKLHWMPIDLHAEGLTEANWADSKFQKAIDFIKACGNDQSRCQWKALPTGP